MSSAIEIDPTMSFAGPIHSHGPEWLEPHGLASAKYRMSRPLATIPVTPDTSAAAPATRDARRNSRRLMRPSPARSQGPRR